RTAVREGRQPAAVSRSLPELRTSLGLSTENQANQLRSTRACSAVSRPPRQYRAYGLPHFVLAWASIWPVPECVRHRGTHWREVLRVSQVPRLSAGAPLARLRRPRSHSGGRRGGFGARRARAELHQ